MSNDVPTSTKKLTLTCVAMVALAVSTTTFADPLVIGVTITEVNPVAKTSIEFIESTFFRSYVILNFVTPATKFIVLGDVNCAVLFVRFAVEFHLNATASYPHPNPGSTYDHPVEDRIYGSVGLSFVLGARFINTSPYGVSGSVAPWISTLPKKVPPDA